MLANPSHPWWSRAITLAECASARVRVVGDDTPSHGDVPSRRLDRWRKQRPFGQPELLGRRLAVDALTDREFDAAIDARTSAREPAWVERLTAVRRLAPPLPPPALGSAERDSAGIALARAFIEPLAVAALGTLFASASRIRAACPNAPFDPDTVVRQLEPSLWNQLVARCFKVGVLELNVARVTGTLVGNTPEERYADFARQLRTTDLRNRILEEYPVLARSLVTAIELWERAATELLRHVAEDIDVLTREFGGGVPLGTIATITTGAGDTHRHGRSVCIVGFSSGVRVVYKPRSLATDVCFERMVEWLNDCGQTPRLEAVHSLDCGSHGWAAFAAQAECASLEHVTRFYERFGSYLALLHVLEATDFHYENVIAAGEHPTLIDLEALFHPRLTPPPELDDPDALGWNVLQHSVLRSGVLPFRAYGNASVQGMDLSAVGGGESQQTPNRFPTLVDAGTDVMRFERTFVMLPPSQNRPALGGQVVDPTRYIGRILAGFAHTYRLLLAHRATLLAPDGPVHAFAGTAIRVVLRPTRQYALILMESYHPDVLRDALDRDLLIDRLWLAIPSRPELERTIAYEHADLVVGDVPLFGGRPDSYDLFTTHGTRIENYFAQTGLSAAIERISALSEQDLEQQLWVVRASFAALEPGHHEARQGSSPALIPRRAPNATGPSADESIAAAASVARRLTRLALRNGNRVTWLGLTLAMERNWVIQPVGPDLYGGTLGIAVFLAHAGHIAGDLASEELARAVAAQSVGQLRALLRHDALNAGARGAIGAFGALGGAVYAFSHLGALWKDDTLFDAAEEAVERARSLVADDAQLDIIGGSAGLAMAAATLDRVRPGGVARGVLRACAEHLLIAADQCESGIAWTTRIESMQPLTGFSHGASGIAAALVTAGNILSDDRYTNAALGALRYERGTFDATVGNWPDYRILNNAPVSTPFGMWAWCHGAPGIGLSRLVALSSNEASVRSDLDIAIASTVANGFESNDSLCHGDLGNLELLLRARELGLTGAWEHALTSEAARLVERIGGGAWYCGIPGGVETPGLMMGLAGIGYGLLRIGATDRVPSLLALEAPRLTMCRAPQP